jgi:uncharacterized membrane protein YqjE
MAIEDRDPRDQSMGELFAKLSDDLSILVRQELKLAQVEMTEKGKRAGIGIGMLGGAGLVGLLAALTLTTCFVGLLSTQMKVWIAALIVTAAYAALAGLLALQGKNRIAEAAPPAPEQTIDTLKENAQWAKTQLPSGSK